MLTVGSLSTGIGGIDLGLERAGMTVRWQSEIDPLCCEILARHWPDVPNLGDLHRIDWSTVERVSLLAGGYPCQPFSLAGQRGGEQDPRHLWPRYADAVRHLRPDYVLLENVPGHLSLGFGRVLGDLAEIGYDCEWDCVPAAFVGAPHLRYRVIVVAYADGAQRVELRDGGGRREVPPQGLVGQLHGGGRGADVADSEGVGRRRVRDAVPAAGGGTVGGGTTSPGGRGRPLADSEGVAVRTGLRPHGTPGERQRRPRDGGRSDLASVWAVEPDVGRVADGVPARLDRLRALGNAVVPQVAELIGRRLIAAVEGLS